MATPRGKCARACAKKGAKSIVYNIVEVLRKKISGEKAPPETTGKKGRNKKVFPTEDGGGKRKKKKRKNAVKNGWRKHPPNSFPFPHFFFPGRCAKTNIVVRTVSGNVCVLNLQDGKSSRKRNMVSSKRETVGPRPGVSLILRHPSCVLIPRLRSKAFKRSPPPLPLSLVPLPGYIGLDIASAYARASESESALRSSQEGETMLYLLGRNSTIICHTSRLPCGARKQLDMVNPVPG